MNEHDIEELRKQFERFDLRPVEEKEMPFGKHRLKKVQDVPRPYLRWFAKHVKIPLALEIGQYLKQGKKRYG